MQRGLKQDSYWNIKSTVIKFMITKTDVQFDTLAINIIINIWFVKLT